jgi:hypothetical protein
MNNSGWCPIISNGDSKSKCVFSACAWYDLNEDDCVAFIISKDIKKITSNDKYDLEDIVYKIDDVVESI